MIILFIFSLILILILGVLIFLIKRMKNIKTKIVCRVVLSMSLIFSILLFCILTTIMCSMFYIIKIPIIRYSKSDYSLEYKINDIKYIRTGTIKCRFKGLNGTPYSWNISPWRDYETEIITDDDMDKYNNKCYLGNVTFNKIFYDLYLVFPERDSGYFLRNPSEYPKNNISGFSEEPKFSIVSSMGEEQPINKCELTKYGFEILNWTCNSPKFNIYVPYSLGWNIIFIFAGVCFITFKILRKYN